MIINLIKIIRNFREIASMLMFHDEGIWFEEEDPTSEYYRPECCKNVYLDHAKGKFDKNAKKYKRRQYDDDDSAYDADYDF
jgi:hypothetical protein